MTEELFDRYTHNQCSIEERYVVEEWMENCTDNELVILLQSKWDAENERMPDLLSAGLWETLCEKIQLSATDHSCIRKINYFTSKRNWLAAASIIVLLVSGYSIFLMKDKTVIHTKNQTTASKSTSIIKWIRIDNDQSKNKNIVLKDNTRIVLYPFSSLRYAVDFNSKDRNVYLNGKADFSIAKNKAKPFTVFAGEIATTAVGTRFQVINNPVEAVISVKLYEGIVRIQSIKRSISGWKNGKLLYPGEEVRFENGKATAKLKPRSETEKNNPSTVLINTGSVDEINFSNAPLSEVFEKMEKMFRIKINYTKSDVLGMYLTTTINKKDQPVSILNAIVQMNALSYQEMDEGFTITKLTDLKK